jgi:hypothetical protein
MGKQDSRKLAPMEIPNAKIRNSLRLTGRTEFAADGGAAKGRSIASFALSPWRPGACVYLVAE